MREVLPELLRWWQDGHTIGVGTVVGTWRSAPRPPGAAMLVGPEGEAVGSVSGGCVEGAVYELAQEVVSTGDPVLQRYGVSDDDAFAVGLTCGGILDVFVEKVSQETFPELGDVAADIAAGRPVAVATVVEHPDPAWLGRRLVIHPEEADADGQSSAEAGSAAYAARMSLGSDRADAAVVDDARGMLDHGTTGLLTYGP
ncbi:MAG TPA: XdhC family protein, partial [Intrasporangium sp.]|nr:XdhC family protein [Intrasporangium sp.]